VLGVAGLSVGAGVLWLAAAPPLAVDPLVGALASGAGIGAAGSAWLARSLGGSLARLGPSDALEDFAAAVVVALRDAGGLRPSLGPQDVRVVLQEDGYYRCYLAHASREESGMFAASLDELLGPLAAPRYLIPRDVADPPRSALDVLRLAGRLALRGRVGERVVYHAVPAYLGVNAARVRVFERAWRRFVSPGHALYYQNPRAQAILELQAGESPLATTSQLRTVWR
jgi:hypothetical protein